MPSLYVTEALKTARAANHAAIMMRRMGWPDRAKFATDLRNRAMTDARQHHADELQSNMFCETVQGVAEYIGAKNAPAFIDNSIFQGVVSFTTDTGEEVRATLVDCSSNTYAVSTLERDAYIFQANVRTRSNSPRAIWAAYKHGMKS